MSDSGHGTLGATVTPNAPRAGDVDEALPVTPADRYVVERELGMGGQSVVFAVRDAALNREVALKTARQRGEAAGGFVREARITGQLEHPGIVPVHELGRTPQGEYYCTQKLVRGRTFRQALEEATTLDARLALLPHFIDLCHAVAYAHSRGVVHRDLKPENVMVGEFGETVVLDWGVARVLGGPDELPPESAKLAEVKPLQTVRRLDGVLSSGSTQHGSVIGTPLYMSPEQARGENHLVDARSDVWSLGVILYELLAFARPFDARDVRSLLIDVGRGIFRPLRDLAPEAPPELVAIVEHALQADRDQRPADARALAAQVADFRAGKRVAAYQYTSWELVKRFVARNRALTAVSVAAVVALSISEIYAWNLVDERDTALQTARANLGRALVSQAVGSAFLRDWNRSFAEWTQAAEQGAPGASLAARALDSWRAPLLARKGEMPQPATGVGAFDVESGVGVLSSPGRGVFLMADDASWRLQEGTTDPERRPLPNAVALGGRLLAWKTGTVRVASPNGGSTQNVAGTDKAQLLTFAADESTLAIAQAGAVLLVDPASGTTRATLQPAPETPTALALGRTGRAVAVAGTDATLRWWAGDDAALHEPAGEGFVASALCFSGDERLVFAADGQNQVRVFDARSGALVRTLSGHRYPVVALALAPSGEWLASGSSDGELQLWDLDTFKPAARLMHDGADLRAISFTIDGTRLGAMDRAGRRREWNVKSLLAHRAHARLTDGIIAAIDVAPEGQLWVRTTEALTLLSAEGEPRWRQPEARGNDSLALGDSVLVARTGQIDRYALDDGARVQSVNPCRATVWALAGRPGDDFVWMACGNEVLALDAETLEVKSTPIRARTAVKRLALSPTGDRLAWASEDGNGALVALPSLQEEESWSGLPLQALAFSSNGALLATVGEGGLVVRSAKTGAELRKLVTGALRARALAFAMEDSALWVAGYEKLSLWNVAASGAVAEVPGLGEELTAAVPMADGLWAADATGRLFRYDFPALAGK